MPNPLTELERRVLDYLVEYLRTHTYQPSIREIGAQFSIKSTKTVSELLHSLADKGWIERDPSRSRGVRLLGVDLTAGIVGVPLFETPDSAAPHTHIQLDERVAGGSGAFLVPMNAEHLREEGIRPGDLLLIEPVAAEAVESHDLLLARVGASTTVRRCIREASQIVLEPIANEDLATSLTPRQAAAVVKGRVAAVIRRLRPLPDRAAPLATPV